MPRTKNTLAPFAISRSGSRGYFRNVLQISGREFILVSDGTAKDCSKQQTEVKKALEELSLKYIRIGAEGARGEDKDTETIVVKNGLHGDVTGMNIKMTIPRQ